MRRLFTIVLVAVVSSSALLAAGCSSANGRPYALTGENRQLSAAERARYSDDKGRFHPEWVREPGR